MGTFDRSSGTRFYRRLFLISSEGHVTEPSYFSRFNSPTLRVECLSEKGKSAPLQVLERLKKAMNKRRLQPGDQLWLVVDRDEWREQDLNALAAWTKEAGATSAIRRGLALSNPKFEVWLLQHFEDAAANCTARACVARLTQFMPDYVKHVDHARITDDSVVKAVERGNAVLVSEEDWPRTAGASTVSKLVEEILKIKGSAA